MLKNCIPFLPVLKKHQKKRFRYIFPFRRKPAQKTLSKRRKKEIPQQKTGFNAKFFAVLP